MSMQKFRWSRVYESSEEELVGLLQARRIKSERLVVEADSAPLERTAKAELRIWCGEGSLSIRTDNANTSLQPGDAVIVDPQTNYSLIPGISGYICYFTS